jgi:hypothetical protein
MFKPLKWAAVALPMISLFFVSGCGTQVSHPNQINAFDGATYDSLTVAHAALTSLRTSVPVSYPQYTTIVNQASAAYGSAYASYTSFRSAPTAQAEVAAAIANLAAAIVVLENDLAIGLQPAAKDEARVRDRAKRLKASAKQAGVTISDILTELEIAAAVASAIPQASPNAGLALIVIASTNSALAAETAEAGQPIDLTLIQPIPPIE